MPQNERMLSVAEARRLFYVNSNGVLCWRIDHSSRARADRVAGTPHVSGGRKKTVYMMVNLRGVMMYAHRISYLIHTGRHANGVIDHIDGDGLNNSPDNLRDVTRSANQTNRKRQANNTTGVIGVILHRKTGRYVATFQRKWLGSFPTLFEAACARKSEEVRFWRDPSTKDEVTNVEGQDDA